MRACAAEAAADVRCDSPRPCRRPRRPATLRADQADIADVVLGAGMMAAGEMDVDRRVERRRAASHHARDLGGMLLGVGGGELAAGRAGAGDQAGADRRGLASRGRAPRSRPWRASTLSSATPGDQQVLPDRQPDIAVAEIARRSRPAPRIWFGGQLADRQRDADPVQARLLLRVDADMRRCGRRPGAARPLPPARGSAARPSFSSTAARNFSTPQASSTYLSRALLRLVRSPCR